MINTVLRCTHTKQNEVVIVANEKRKHATFTLPSWLLVELDGKALKEFRSKSQMVEEALIKHFGFKRGE